jgi:hypothetical protein
LVSLELRDSALCIKRRGAFPISKIMPNKKMALRKRGRPPTGKKGYFIRMSPDTHDTLVKMAEDEVTNLDGLFHQFAANWKSRKKFVMTKDPTRLNENILSLIYDAPFALKQLQPFMDHVLHQESTRDAWREFVEEFETLKKFKCGEE